MRFSQKWLGRSVLLAGLVGTASAAYTAPLNSAPSSQPAEPTRSTEEAPVSPPGPEAPTSQPAKPSATPAVAQSAVAATQPAPPEPDVKPRLELHVPSLRSLVSQARASHSGIWLGQLERMLWEMGTASAESVDLEELSAIGRQIKDWPDTSIHAGIYAPDTEGRSRWAVKLDWPLKDLHARLAPLLSSDATAVLLEGVTLKTRAEGGYELALPESTLGFLLPGGDAHSYVASHPDLELPAESLKALVAGPEGAPSLMTCRLNLTATEKDSGATMFSSFRAVTDVVYSGRVDNTGDWLETVAVHWPPISGMGAKVFLSKVKQSFFVPEEAFGGLAVNSMTIPSMLVNAMGLGPQFVMDASGQMSMMGDAESAEPIASVLGSEACLTILPGTGVLPAPDIVVQVRAKRPEKLIEAIRAATEKTNELHVERDQKPPWTEAKVRDQVVFWSEGGGHGMVMLPMVMRPVLFISKESDAQQKEREFLVAAWTSTSPEGLVRRWLDLPRKEKRRELPTEKKTDGQMWVHWKQVYKWVCPYINMTLSVVARDALLPRVEEIAAHLTDAWLTLDVGYTGITLSHRGPFPMGTLAVPVLAELSVSTDDSGSDLARERLASQRLKVLYHHCKLFKKDLGRWPADVTELDGYVDFEGHADLLQLNLSSKKQWNEWVKEIFEAPKKEEAEEDEEGTADIDAKRFVVEWKRDAWSLGYVPGTFEHLERLCIDQDGKIQRLEKKVIHESSGP